MKSFLYLNSLPKIMQPSGRVGPSQALRVYALVKDLDYYPFIWFLVCSPFLCCVSLEVFNNVVKTF